MNSILDLAIAISIADFASDGINKIIGQFKLLEGASKETLKQMEKYKNIAFGGTALAAIGAKGFKETAELAGTAVTEAANLQEVMTEIKSQTFGKDLFDPSKLDEINGKMKEINKLSSKIGLETTFSKTDVAEVFLELSKGGIQYKDLINGMTEATMKFAQLEKIAPLEAAEIMVQTRAGFGLSGKETYDSADIVTKVSAASSSDALDINRGLNNMSGVAAEMWKSRSKSEQLLDSSLLVALTRTQTAEGSSAGTYVRNFLERLVPKTDKQTDAMDSVGWLDKNGKSIFMDYSKDPRGNLKSATDIAKIIRNTVKGYDVLTDTKQIEEQFKNADNGMKTDKLVTLFHSIFGAQGGRTAYSMLREGEGSIEEIIENYENQLSLSERVSFQQENFNQILDTTKEGWDTFLTALGSPLLEYASRGAQFLGDKLSIVTGYLEEHPEISKYFFAIAGGVTAFMTLAGAGMVVYAAVGALNLALATAGLTLGGVVMTSIWAVGIFAGVVAIGYLIYKNWDSVTSIWERYGWTVKLVGSILLVAYTPAILVAIGSMIKLATVTGLTTIKTVGLYIAHGAASIVMGAFRSIMLAVTAAQWIYGMATGTATASTLAQRAAAILLAPTILTIKGLTAAWTVAQTALSAAMTANPIGVVIVIIGALIGVVFLAIKYWDVWTGKLKSFADWIPDWGLVLLSIFVPIVGIPLTLIKYWDKAIAKVKEFFNVKDNKGKGDLNKTVKETEPVQIPTVLDHKGFFQQMQDMKSKKDQMPTFDIPANADFTKLEEQLMNFNLDQNIESLNLPTDLDFTNVSEQLEAFNLGKNNIEGLDIPVDLDTKALLEQTAGLEKTMNLTGNNATLQLAQGMSSGQSISEVTASSKAINSAFKKQLPKASEMKTYGANLGTSLAKGISSKQSEVKKAAENMAKTINDYLGVHSPTKEGPLRTNHLWGGNLMKSIASSMMNDLELVKSAANSVANAMNIKGEYQLDSPSSGIRVKHPSETNSNQVIIQGPLIGEVHQQKGEDTELFAKRVAKLVKQEIDTEKKRSRLTVSGKLLTT